MGFIFFFPLILQNLSPSFLEKGEKLFDANCQVCHPRGENVILPEKNLAKENLAANGMNSIDSVVYQVRNGKNGMPAFGDRLDEKKIKIISEYLLFQSDKNFEIE
jgi:cytochrome c6